MMVMSAFVAIPTYNVQADGHEDVGPETFHATMTMESLEDWMVDFYGVMPVDWSDDMREDLSMMCADMMGTDEGEITEDCVDWWMEGISDGDGGEHHEGGCPPGLTDEECNAFRDCEHSDAVLDCSRMRYDICVDDDSFDFCHEEDADIINSIFEYEDGVKSADDFVDIWASLFDDGGDNGTDPALYDIQTFTIGEDDAGTYKLYKNFMSSYSSDFICGSGANYTVPFYWINDGYDDCEDGSDEQKYDDDGNEINWFDCHDGSEVWIHQVNDGYYDCADGEDEYQEHWWNGNLFFFSGILEDPEDTTNLITGVGHFCGWDDEDEVSWTCEESAVVELSAGDYSVLTTGTCSDEWTDEDEDGEDDSPGVIECNNFGEYNHSLKHVDSGEVVSLHSEINYDDSSMEISDDHWSSIDYISNFVLYDTFELTVGSDGFDGAITSVQWECYDWDEDGEYDDCWGSDLTLYLYEYSFNPDVPRDNILGANDDSYDEDLDCPSPSDDCNQSVIQVELSEGTYVVVTAGYSSYSENAYYLNHMVTRDGDIIETWDGELWGSYYSGGENVTIVLGDARTYLPSAHEFDDDDGDYYGWLNDVISALASHKDGTMTASEAADSIVATIYEADEEGLLGGGGGDGHHHWESYDGGHCEWEGEADNQENAWYCKYSEEDEYWDNWWYYCEVYYDDDGSERWVCTDDFGQDSDYEFSAGNTHYKDDTSPYDHDEDDNPALLDGIVGVTDPEDNDPMPMNENLIGSVSDNEGSPLLMGTSFKVHFNGADDSLDTHELSIPTGEDGEDWYVELSLLERYEVISCDNCATLEIEGSEARFHANEPVTITFGLRPDCDHVVGLDASGYGFDPADLTISVGETVCWQWTDASDVHNVLELESEFDEDMDLTAVSVGFFSGAPSNTVDFRHTFTEDNMTHYYVCEPHATMGMVGKITVGEGSEEDPVEEIVEESGLPSIGFVVGVLVLIGAAGLRRRIH